MRFVDSTSLEVVAGRGGDGCVAFRREKYMPHGGPSGGDGGRGGDVVFRVDTGLSTLLDLAYARTLTAKSGEPGRGKDQYGRSGEDLVVRVPMGTQILDAESGALLWDLAGETSTAVVAKGGKGGRGNIHFASAVERAPRRAEPGEPGETRKLRLELKVLADVGLLGFPNVGKSTFIRAASRARPKVADYPFTTLTPHLGVVSLDVDHSFVIADIPGLIPGAAEGAGLGIRFLKHVERTRVLLHLVSLDPGEGRDPFRDYLALRKELARYSPELEQRPEVVALTKSDLPDVRAAYPSLRKRFEKKGLSLFLVSAATGDGVRPMLVHLDKVLRAKAIPLAKPASKKPKKVAARPTKKRVTKTTAAKRTKKKSPAREGKRKTKR